MGAAQARWLPKVIDLVEPPTPGSDFPAFLLETTAFDGVRYAIEEAGDAVDTATQDLVQHFVDQYRHYLDWTEAELNAHRCGSRAQSEMPDPDLING